MLAIFGDPVHFSLKDLVTWNCPELGTSDAPGCTAQARRLRHYAPYQMDQELGVEDLRRCHQIQAQMRYVNHCQELGVY